MKTIIAFTGHLGCGKTTAAKVLVKEYGFICVHFADVLKRMLKKLGLSDAQVYGDEKEIPSDLLGGKTPRYAMQTLGTEWGRRAIFDDIWVRATMQTIERISDKQLKVVIDDCRFLNEVKAVEEAGGTIIKVLRDGYEGDGHQSETEMNKIFPDFTIGAKDVPELTVRVHNILEMMGVSKVVEVPETVSK